MNDPYYRRAQLIRVIDGDTLRLRIDLGWNIYADHNVRLLDVNAPEMHGESRAAGEAAKQYAADWLAFAEKGAAEWPLLIRSEKGDAFGRYLVEVYCSTCGDDRHNLNEWLLKSGNAVAAKR